MRNPRLFTDQPLTPGDQVVLKGNAAQHLGRVLRARVGDHIALFNGDGQEFTAQVLTVSKGEITVDIGAAATPDTESLVYTALGLCLSKGDRFDWAIQKATELGVGATLPSIRFQTRSAKIRMSRTSQRGFAPIKHNSLQMAHRMKFA